MLQYVLDRVTESTLIYAGLSYATWQARDLVPLQLVYAAIFVLSAWYLNALLDAVNRELKLSRLGARAPSIRTWTPYNLGMIYSAVRHMVSHRNHEWWWKNFAYASNGREGQAWTAESITMTNRIIFTADEENIKAVLATQFGKYGKGPQFRKEWKDFLGLSMSPKSQWPSIEF